MSCNYQETDASKISRDIAECKESGKRIADLAEQIKKTIQLNEQIRENYNRDLYLWNRAESQLAGNITTLTDRIKRIEAERQGDWGTRCGALGQYDYHCQLGNFLNQELYPQLAVFQKRYSTFLSTFPKPQFTQIPVPNFDSTMVCQACVQCVNQTDIKAGGNINTSLNQVNNCTINLERRLEEAKNIKPPIVTPPPPIVTPDIGNPVVIPRSQDPYIEKEPNNNMLIFLLIFIFIIFIALGGAAYYFYNSGEDVPNTQNIEG